MRSNIYLLFAFFAGIGAVGIAVFMVIITASTAVSPSDFREYAYSEYIDRSLEMNFTADGGAQLYEAERAHIEKGADVQLNPMASGGKVVGDLNQDATLIFTISSDSKCSARLFLSVSNPSPKAVPAMDLFSLRRNGYEIGLRSMEVDGSTNTFDFKESALCTMEMERGENRIEIVAKADNFTIDYLVLVSKDIRTSLDPVIGVPFQSFLTDGSTQRFEAEKAGNDGAVAYEEEKASGGLYMRFFTERSAITFYPKSDINCTASLSIALRSPGSSARVSDLCSLYVNGRETPMSPSGTGTSDNFSVLFVNDVALGKGVNDIRLVKNSGVFDIDYIELVRIEDPAPRPNDNPFA